MATGNVGAITLYAVPGNIISDADYALLDPTTAATFFAAATLVEGKVVERYGSTRQHMEVSAA